MAKIEKLTEAQKARLSEFAARWTDIGLSTAPAARPRAEAAIREMYRCAGLEPPRTIVWCGSPLSQGLTRAIVLDKALMAKVAKNLPASVWASVRASVWASVGASVGASVWDSVGASVGASVWASVGDSVGASVGASVWASVRASVWASVYGAQDAAWLAFYRYFAEVCGLTAQTEKLTGLWELAQSAGWAIPHQNVCWVSERHSILARDERGRLHSLGGPAVAYPDGWAIYAVHGVRVPEYIIERPQEITVEKIDKEANAEVRRVMIERYRHGDEVMGAGAYIRDAGAKRIDHDEQFGTLWQRDIPNDEPIVMIEVVNRSPEPDGHFRHYFLRVDPECRPLLADGTKGDPQPLNARAAVASTFGKRAHEYAPMLET